MFSDMVGFTALMARSEARAREARARHRTLVRSRVRAHRGSFVDESGDEILATFDSALDAVSCAVAIQRALEGDPELRVRIGIHLGDVVFERRRVYGDGVNLAARIRPLAQPGGICVSDEVRQQVRNQPGLRLAPLGAHELKNVDRPIEVFALEADGAVGAPPAAPRTALRPLAIAGGLLLACAIALVWLAAPRPAARVRPPEAAPGPGARTAILVLPFDNLADPAQEPLTDGLTEEIIHALAHTRGLQVVARTSAFAFKGRHADVREIGASLGVGTVLEGSTRREADRLRVTAQLIDVRSGLHLWSESFDHRVEGLFDVQERIARAIAGALEVEVVRTGGRVHDFRTYERFLRALDAGRSGTEHGLRAALEGYREVLAAEPDYAPAYTAIARAYLRLWMVYSGEGRDGPLLARAEAAARSALSLDDTNGEAHAALGTVLAYRHRDWNAAEREFVRARELAPGDAETRFQYANFLLALGRLPEAGIEIHAAFDLDPLSAHVNRNVGRYHLYAEELDAAISFLLRAREQNPDEPSVPDLLAKAYLFAGLNEEALEAWLSQSAIPAWARPPLRIVGRAAGLRRSMGLALSLATRLGGERCPGDAYGAAEAHAFVGDAESMLDCLQRASARTLYYVRVDPIFDAYRSDPSFERLLAQSGYRD
jgi:TolB-like protein